MTFKKIGSRVYDRIDLNGNLIDTIEIVGEMPCKAANLTGMCEKKCMGQVWLDSKGHKYCPFPYGVSWVRR